MTSKTIAEGILRALGVIVAIVILLAFLYKISAVLIYIAIAAVASLIGRPIVLFFRQKLKFNNTVAVIITMIFLVGVVAGVIALFVPLLIQQGQNLSLLNIDALQTNLEDLYRQLLQYIGVKSEDLEQSIKDSQLFFQP